MTNSLTLREKLKADPKTRRVLGDVLPVDLLPKRRLRRTPRLFIINTDDSTGPGEHWVLVFFTGHNRGIYFDSYGLDVMDTRIQDFLTKNCSSYYTKSQWEKPSPPQGGILALHFLKA